MISHANLIKPNSSPHRPKPPGGDLSSSRRGFILLPSISIAASPLLSNAKAEGKLPEPSPASAGAAHPWEAPGEDGGGRDGATPVAFYWHIKNSGADRTSYNATPGDPSAAATSFGVVTVFDNPVTSGPDPSSTPLGRAQGFFVGAQRHGGVAVMMVTTVVFPGVGTITLVGRDVYNEVNGYLFAVGGTGRYVGATGYLTVKLHSRNPNTGDPIAYYEGVVVTNRHFPTRKGPTTVDDDETKAAMLNELTRF